jgi:hypothetical protein
VPDFRAEALGLKRGSLSREEQQCCLQVSCTSETATGVAPQTMPCYDFESSHHLHSAVGLTGCRTTRPGCAWMNLPRSSK